MQKKRMRESSPMIRQQLRKHGTAIFLVVTVLLITAFGGLSRADVIISPGQACVSADCHGEFGKAKYIHLAMDENDCSSCHEQQGEIHAFEYPATGDELCAACHDKFDQKKNRHAALEDGCITCHNPHQSNTEHLLEADDLPSLCFVCHDDSMVKKKWSHGPAEAGECAICHSPHESDNAVLLLENTPGLCFTCHSETGEELKKRKVVHAAIDEGCNLCHNPHGQDFQFFLSEEVPQLCYTCHDDIEKIVTNATYKHGIVEKDKRCLNCHLPHSSDYDVLLSFSKEDMCFGCHNKSIDSAIGKIPDMKNLVSNFRYPHGPVADNDCASCHSPHGSKNYAILTAGYPDRFYASYSEATYELCFTCHDSRVMKFEKTTKLTDFRDGPRNLHYLHVNKPFKGRACTACHGAHGSNNPKNINDKTPFGTWEMPIRFKKTETGGSCYPGCHKAQTYEHEKPASPGGNENGSYEENE